MDATLRVAERFLLAKRVAERVKTGDAIGDPKEILAVYKRLLTVYAGKEHDAKEWLRLHEEIKKHYLSVIDRRMKGEVIDPKEIEKKRRELQIERDGGGVGTGEYTNKGQSIIGYLNHGFPSMVNTAKILCFAILQQLALPPKLRKSIEVASRFWSKSPRLNVKGGSYDETIAKGVALYLDLLDTFKKHEKLFEDALRVGKTHSDSDPEGGVVTKYKAGPFTLVNTGGFDDKTMVDKSKLFEVAAEKMHAIGLGKVCYGDVLVTNQLSNKRVQAFYLLSKDEVFVRGDTGISLDMVHSVCHELTHRLEEKFLASKKPAIVALYNTLKVHGMVEKMPDIGETVTYQGTTLVVDERDVRRKILKLMSPENPLRRLPVSLATFRVLKGDPPNPMSFVSDYAKRGGPQENFAEMVAFYAMGKLPEKQVELLLPIIS